jgi:hypothetical protein
MASFPVINTAFFHADRTVSTSHNLLYNLPAFLLHNNEYFLCWM